jgi:hypothetical protein
VFDKTARWDSIAVLERDFVIGTENSEAWKYIKRVWAQMRQEWKECFKRLISAESREYEKNSYFK